MLKVISREEALERLRAAVEVAGSRAAFCQRAECSKGDLAHMLNSQRDITGKVASYLGLKKVVAYSVTENNKDPRQEQYENDYQAYREQSGYPLIPHKGVIK